MMVFQRSSIYITTFLEVPVVLLSPAFPAVRVHLPGPAFASEWRLEDEALPGYVTFSAAISNRRALESTRH